MAPALVSRGRMALSAVLHGLALLALFVALGLMHVVVPPFPRKFFCDDQSIKYPSGKCTVPYYILAPVGVVSAWITVAVAEWSLAKGVQESQRRHLATLVSFGRRVFATDFRARYFAQVMHGVYTFCLALATCDFLMGMAKNCFGRHRPFFYSVCRPELPAGGCNSSVAYDISVCRPVVGPRDFWDARRSFPSGHASFGAFCGTFIVLYLYRRGHGLYALLRLTVQLLAAVGGLYAGYSRVSDYKHHWSDVLAGELLGAVLAWVATSAVPAAISSGSSSADVADARKLDSGSINGAATAEISSVDLV